MSRKISEKTLRRLDIQGFDHVPASTLAPVAEWLRFPYVLCALLASVGVALGSPVILGSLALIALLAALFPVHPFDLIFNHGLRHWTGTGPFPKRGAPARFACGMGSVWLVGTGWAFAVGHTTVGHILGTVLAGMATLVATTNICLPSLVFRTVYGPPRKRAERRVAMDKAAVIKGSAAA